MISDTDWEILDKRLKAIEDSLEMLKALFPDIPVVECSDEYILEQGSLTDAGTKQQWRNKDD